MKVLLIDVNCKNSSTGKIVYDLHHKLREDGHQAAICYGRGEKIYEPEIYKFGLDWETLLHALLARTTGLNGCFSYFSTKRLIKFIDDYKPDVIHIHELHAYFVNIKLLLEHIKKRKIKVVWTFHCEYMYTGKCGYAYDCEAWKTQCSNCPAISQYPKSLFWDRTKRMFRMKQELLEDLEMVIVTPSKWLADRVQQSFLQKKTTQIIHNGIDTETIFYPRKSDGLYKKFGIEGRKIILAVAPNIMDERKGGSHILKISESFQNDVVFVMIGTEVTGWHSSNVLMIKKTKNQNELAEWYSLANVFLICNSTQKQLI